MLHQKLKRTKRSQRQNIQSTLEETAPSVSTPALERSRSEWQQRAGAPSLNTQGAPNPSDSTSHSSQLFDQMDSNRDGVINRSEFHKAVSKGIPFTQNPSKFGANQVRSR